MQDRLVIVICILVVVLHYLFVYFKRNSDLGTEVVPGMAYLVLCIIAYGCIGDIEGGGDIAKVAVSICILAVQAISFIVIIVMYCEGDINIVFKERIEISVVGGVVSLMNLMLILNAVYSTGGRI